MPKPREELQTFLEDILGTRQVYFNPPETVKMQYPAIVYNLNAIGIVHADNTVYQNTKSYAITIIDYDPDSELADVFMKLPLCSFNRTFKADNLYHYVYTLYF